MFPHIKYVLDKFRHKLPKDELKRLGKDLANKLVASDYKNNRVTDPTAQLNEKQARKIKTFSKEFLDKAVHKFEAQKQKPGQSGAAGTISADKPAADGKVDEAELSDVDMDDSPASRKRKHDADADTDLPDATPTADGPDVKRLKEDEAAAGGSATATPSPPPPPPPPPEEGGGSSSGAEMTEEQQALREQEEALERENEEAQRLEDEEEAQRTTNGEQQGPSRKQEVLSH